MGNHFELIRKMLTVEELLHEAKRDLEGHTSDTWNPEVQRLAKLITDTREVRRDIEKWFEDD